jgi:hypothetical protein
MKSRLLGSSRQTARKAVVIKVIVLDVHHVRVFISHGLTAIRVATIVTRIRKRVDSVLKVSVQVCSRMPLSVAAIVLVPTTIMRKAATSLVRVVINPVAAMDSKVVISLVRVAISSVAVTVSVLRTAIVLATIIIMRKAATSLVRVVTSSVAVMVSRAAISPVRVATSNAAAMVSSAVVMVSSVAAIASIPPAMILMPSIA